MKFTITFESVGVSNCFEGASFCTVVGTGESFETTGWAASTTFFSSGTDSGLLIVFD